MIQQTISTQQRSVVPVAVAASPKSNTRSTPDATTTSSLRAPRWCLDRCWVDCQRAQRQEETTGDKLLTLAEVAEITRLPQVTLRWPRDCGKGPKFGTLGRRVIYREADVVARVERQFHSETAQGVA